MIKTVWQGTANSRAIYLRPINHRLTERKSGTYDSEIRDLRLESAIVTARNIILMKRNIVFYMIITHKSFIFNYKLNVSFTLYDRQMTDIVNIKKSVSMLFYLLSERYMI